MQSIRLRSGRELLLRPIRPDDDERLGRAYARLSPESKYRRFLAIKPRLSRSDLEYLVGVDAHDHVALVAMPPDDPGAIVAVARFVRLADDPGAAEFAIVVGDPYQRDGLGSAILQRLGELALEHGVERLVATVLADNVGAHRLINGLSPAPPRWTREGVVDHVELELVPQAIDRLAA